MYRIEGRDYWIVVGSSVERDGMFLECTPKEDGAEVLIEIFYRDQDGAFTMQTSGAELPLALVKLVIAEAERLLPPWSRDQTPGT